MLLETYRKILNQGSMSKALFKTRLDSNAGYCYI